MVDSDTGRIIALASSGRGVITGPATITDTLLINIDNHNDRPLEITGIRAFQLEHRLFAKLNAGYNYTISTGDDRANVPTYDLQHFRDSIPASISVLSVPPLTAAVKVAAAGPSFAPNMKWVWAFIIGLGALMAVVAVRMMRRASHEETLDNNSPN